MAEQKLYAFWRHETMGHIQGFVLGGHVTQIRDDGAVETKEFGVGHWFWPEKIITAKAGEVLNAKIRELEVAYRTAQKKFEAEWEKKMLELFPKAK